MKQKPEAKTAARSRRWLQRCVRRLVFILLGKHNAKNLYYKNHSAKQFEAYANRIGMTVVACDLNAREQSLGDGMVYPLTNTKKKNANESHKGISLADEINLDGKARNHAGTTDNGESVPPVVYLKPGERITHILVKSPNDQELSHAAGDSRLPQTRSANCQA